MKNEVINTKRKMIKRLLQQHKKIEICVRGSSMEPLLKDREKIVITPTNEIKEGDIVFWGRKNGLAFLIHRVIAIYEGMYITKGDNLETFDCPIIYEDIIGSYCPKERWLNLLYKLRARRYRMKALWILQAYKEARTK